MIKACAYVVRKIRASIADGEQSEGPIETPCSAAAKRKAVQGSNGQPTTSLLSSGTDDGVSGAAGSGTSPALQNCGS